MRNIVVRLARLFLLTLVVAAVASAQTDVPGHLTVYPDLANGANACVKLVSLTTGHTAGWCAPSGLSGTYTTTLPASNAAGALVNDGSGNTAWTAVTGAPFSDAGALIKNSSDPTKLAIISAASITTATTRNYLLPDFDMTFAARDVDNNFTSLTQTFGGRINLGASGNSGPGIRDNSGVLECSDDGSTWTACGPSVGVQPWVHSGVYTYLTNAGDFVGVGTTTPIWQLTVQSSDYTSGEHFPLGVRTADGLTAAVVGYRANGTAGVNGIVRSGNNTPLDLGTTGTPQAIRIQNDGTVSIATTNDDTAKLYVVGDARVTGHLFFETDNVSDVGTPSVYGKDIYVRNAHFAPAGVTGNSTDVRKLNVFDDAGGTGFWDIQTQATSSTSNFYIRDNGGQPVIRFHRTVGFSPVDYADVFVDLYPDAASSQKLGKSGQHWNQVWASFGFISNMAPVSGSTITYSADYLPDVTNTRDIGSSGARIKKMWVVDLDCSGTCPGGGTNYWTKAAGVVSMATNGDDLQIKSSGGVQKFYVSSVNGNVQVGALYSNPGGSPTIRMDASGNFTPNSIVMPGGVFNIGSTGNALLASVFLNDLWQGATARISSSGVFNAASYQVAGVSVVDASRNGSFVNLTLSGTCTGCPNFWTRSGGVISAATNGDDLQIKSSGSTQQFYVSASTGNVQVRQLYSNPGGSPTLRMDSSGNFTANSIVFPGGVYQVTSTGAGVFSSVLALGAIGATGLTSGANLNVTSGLIGGASPSSGMSFYLNGAQLRVRFSSGVDKEVSLL